MSNLAFPYGFDTTGRTATTDLPDHIRDMILQILFTSPGERVNRPTFGSGTADSPQPATAHGPVRSAVG